VIDRLPLLRRLAALLSAGALACAAAACDSVFGVGIDVPDQARIEISGQTPVELRLITSKKFELAWDPEEQRDVVVLTDADTTAIAQENLPFVRTIPIEPEGRLLVRLVNPSTEMASITMSVFIDGKKEFERIADVSDSSIEFIQIWRH